jgi:D-specific alpha-keto acid dehydrogenase
VYGCEPDEVDGIHQIAARLGLQVTVVDGPVSVETAGAAAGSRCISVDHRTPVTDGTLRALSQVGVKYISTRSIGCNHIDLAVADAVGIRVGTVAYSPDGVADYTLTLMLMAVGDMKRTLQRVEAHDYRLSRPGRRELRDMTVGIIGTGRIGRAVIERLAGFGCRIVANDADPTFAVEYLSVDDVVGLSDIVSLHVPLDSHTRHLIDARRIGLMKPGAVVVNTGRGSLVDTEALVAALAGGRLGGAALDVLEGEEGIFYVDHRTTSLRRPLLERLQRMPNVIISPHTAFHTEGARRDATEQSLRLCLDFQRETQDA